MAYDTLPSIAEADKAYGNSVLDTQQYRDLQSQIEGLSGVPQLDQSAFDPLNARYREMGFDIGEQQAQDQADQAAQDAGQNYDLEQQGQEAAMAGRGIEGSAMADFLQAPGDQAGARKAAQKKGRAVTAGQEFNMERVTALKQQMLQQKKAEVDREFDTEMRALQQSFQKYTRSTEYNVADEITRQQQQAQKEAQDAQNAVMQTIEEHRAGAGLATAIGGAAGGLLSLIPGVGPLIGGLVSGGTAAIANGVSGGAARQQTDSLVSRYRNRRI
jgi:hypothetical protein